jgi:hypothetical protein
MGRGSYSGAHTVVWVGPDGTLWPTDGELPPAETFKPWDRRDSPKLDQQVHWEKGYQRKLESRFIAACAAALVEGTLSKAHPPPPAHLRKEVKQCGGNANWLRANRARLQAFTKSARGQGWQRENEN